MIVIRKKNLKQSGQTKKSFFLIHFYFFGFNGGCARCDGGATWPPHKFGDTRAQFWREFVDSSFVSYVFFSLFRSCVLLCMFLLILFTPVSKFVTYIVLYNLFNFFFNVKIVFFNLFLLVLISSRISWNAVFFYVCIVW